MLMVWPIKMLMVWPIKAQAPDANDEGRAICRAAAGERQVKPRQELESGLTFRQAKCGMTSEAKSSRVSSSFGRSALISKSTPASWYCPNQVDGLGHRTDKAAQRSAGGQPLALCGQRDRIAGR
jgi:hypothetical protein